MEAVHVLTMLTRLGMIDAAPKTNYAEEKILLSRAAKNRVLVQKRKKLEAVRDGLYQGQLGER